MADGSEKDRKSKSRSKSCKRLYSKNPFINYLKDFRQLPGQQNLPGKIIFKLAGEKWQSLTTSERQPYLAQAQAAKDSDIGTKGKKRNDAEKTKEKLNRKCSECGHRHGNMEVAGSSKTRDDDTSLSSRSRSRSPTKSKSKSGSNSAGSLTTGDTTEHFSDTDTTF